MSAGPACPLCGSASPKTFVREHRAFSLWECPACDAGFCDPFKNPGAAYYESDRDMYGSDLETTTDPNSFEYDEALKTLRGALAPGARLLDVGCGAGGFLHRARAAGFAVSGVDFNAKRAAALTSAGLPTFAGGLPAYASNAPAASFDAVTMFEIVEHLDDPASWLNAAMSLLKPGGLLIIGTPNRERTLDPYKGPGLEEIDLPPHHLTRWSPSALRRFIERNGFHLEECRALPYPLPLIRLMLRNALSFGLATKALGVEQLRHEPAAPAAGAGAIRAAVGLKSFALDAVATVLYPLLRLACAVLGCQGAALYAVARKP